MAIHAYNETYLNNARTTLATMLDYAVNVQHDDIDMIFIEFITSGIAGEFSNGSPKYITGKTGVELYHDIKSALDIDREILPYMSIKRSPEYWAGSYLAYAEWAIDVSMRDIFACVPMSEIVSWYDTAHEADVTRFADDIATRISRNNLKRIRERSGLSQSELSDLTGVSIRNIQMFEQGSRDIYKSQFNILKALSRQLNCTPDDLVSVFDLKQDLLDANNEYKKTIQTQNSEDAEMMYLAQPIIKTFFDDFPYGNIAKYKGQYYINTEDVMRYCTNYWDLLRTVITSHYDGLSLFDHMKKTQVGVLNIDNLLDLIYASASATYKKAIDRENKLD